MARLCLMNLERKQSSVDRQIIVGELNIRVDALLASPGKGVVIVSDGKTMIVAESKVLNRLLLTVNLEENLPWALNYTSGLLL